MRATEKGIEINQAELATLLAFAGDDAKFGVVHFRVNGSGKLSAASSDGKRAVECVAEGLAETGEWHVDRALIEAARRLLDPADTKALLKITAKGIKQICVIGIEDGSVRSTHNFPGDMTSTQITMTHIHNEIVDGSEVDAKMKGTWFATDMRALKPLISLERASAGAPITIFPPKKPTSMVTFETRSEEGVWKGVICPVEVIGPGDGRETDDADELPPGSPRAAPKPLTLAAPLGTEKGKKKAKASKKPRKNTEPDADDEADSDD